MIYAKISNDKVVNLLELRSVNASEFPDCVPVHVPVELGDTYADGKFYRDGQEVKSAEMRVAELEVQLAGSEEATAEEALAILRGEVEA